MMVVDYQLATIANQAALPHTYRLLVEVLGFEYDSGAYDDDLPYAFDTNDMSFMAGGTFVKRDDFACYCIAAFDWLVREGEHRPGMLSLGTHPRLIGRPGRIGGLERDG
jgi:allantoinase